MDNCEFVTPPLAGAFGVASSNTVSLHNITWNGWKAGAPTNTPNNGSVFVSPLDVNSIQVGSLSFLNFDAANHGSTSFGFGALSAVTNASVNNTAMGTIAGYGAQGTGNTFLGTAAGYSAAIATGNNNTCLGAVTGYSLTTGHDNTIIGFNVANILTTGSGNLYLGNGNGVQPQTVSESNTLRIGGASANNVLAAQNINSTIPKVYMTWLVDASNNFTNDAAAAAGGVGVGGIYRNGSIFMVRVT
jgi:hypothetical protein